MSKTKRILDYLAKNPEHTWKDAEAKLSKFDISGGYFAMVKSKHMGKAASGKSAGGKTVRPMTPGESIGANKRGPKPKSKTLISGSNTELLHAAEFAKSVGGIQNAIATLAELAKVQIN